MDPIVELFNRIFGGRKIDHMRRMTEEELKHFGWGKGYLIDFVDHDQYMVLSCDAEGNGPGDWLTLDVPGV